MTDTPSIPENAETVARLARLHGQVEASVRAIEAEMPPSLSILASIRWCLDEYERANIVTDRERAKERAKERALAILSTLSALQQRLWTQTDRP